MQLPARILITIVSICPAAFGQLFSIGIKGGVPLTNAFPLSSFPALASAARSDSKNYLVGGMVELHLPLGFSVEADGLYRPLDFTTTRPLFPLAVPPSQTPGETSIGIQSFANVNSWEFPNVGKYRFGFPIVKPYVEAGAVFRTLGWQLDSFSKHGVVAGIGVELKLARLRLGPEIRYIRWGQDSVPTPPWLVRAKRDQAEFLVGLSF